MTVGDTLIAIAILLFLGLAVWSKWQHQQIKDTLADIKEALAEMRGD